MVFLFVKQRTAYEMRISDWSSDVCSSDLKLIGGGVEVAQPIVDLGEIALERVDFARHGFGILADGGDGVGHGVGGEGGFVDGGGDRGDGLRLGFHCRTDAVDRKSTRLNSSH